MIIAFPKYETYVEPRFHEIKKWIRDGLTEKEIAKKLKISYASLKNYKVQHLAFLSLFKSTKQKVDAMVEESMLNNALGYTYTEQQAIKVKEVYYDAKGRRCQKESVEVVDIERFRPAETVAGKYWLNNRDKENWADNPQMVDIKKEELKFKKEIEENKSW
jgi:hypothetical protein